MKTVEKNTDPELIERILQDDHQALGELYNRYYKKVFQQCLGLVKDHDEAYDLAQEAILKAIESLRGFRRESSFSTWLYTVTHRHCLEMLRKKKKAIVKTADSVVDTAAQLIAEPTDEGMDRSEMEHIMLSLIDKLPLTERELLLRKYSQGESLESLHSVFNLSTSAVKMRLKRSKEKLNQLYMIALTAGLAEALSQLG